MSDDIKDVKGFLVYLERNNPGLYNRYMRELRYARVADILVFIFFLSAIGIVVFALYHIYYYPSLTWVYNTEVVFFFVFLSLTVVSSIFGRRGHAKALEIETEIIVEYHRSGFSGV
ncbi:MAG: hypothetical protein ACTSWN_10250 [Promethearchaeota archaeon]